MSEQYGEFGKNISSLDSAQETVRGVWHDETAKSFDCLNDNVKLCTKKIWALLTDSQAGVQAVKKNYNPEDVDKEIARLGIQIEQV